MLLVSYRSYHKLDNHYIITPYPPDVWMQWTQVGEGSFGAAILCQHDSEKERETKAMHRRKI